MSSKGTAGRVVPTLPGIRTYQGDLVEIEGANNSALKTDADFEVIWKDIDCDNPVFLKTEDIMSLDPAFVELAISMPAFRHLNSCGNIMFEIAPLVRVYGRMRPNDKSMAIKLLQRHNLVVGMCGDGG